MRTVKKERFVESPTLQSYFRDNVLDTVCFRDCFRSQSDTHAELYKLDPYRWSPNPI